MGCISGAAAIAADEQFVSRALRFLDQIRSFRDLRVEIEKQLKRLVRRNDCPILKFRGIAHEPLASRANRNWNNSTETRFFFGAGFGNFARRLPYKFLKESVLSFETFDFTLDLLGRRNVAPALLPGGTRWIFAGGTVSGI